MGSIYQVLYWAAFCYVKKQGIVTILEITFIMHSLNLTPLQRNVLACSDACHQKCLYEKEMCKCH